MLNDPIVSDSKKKKAHKPLYENPFEIIPDFKDIFKATKHETNKVLNEVVSEVFGIKGGDLQPGQELDLKAHHEKEQKSLEKQANKIRPAIDYVSEILKAGEKNPWQDSEETKKQVQELIIELKNLAASTKTLEKQVLEATGHTIVNPGKYHKSFLQYVMSVIRDAKAKIDNAGVWLSAMNGKQKKKGVMGGKKKKTNYWDMAKQHGTKFTLSGERGIATQAG